MFLVQERTQLKGNPRAIEAAAPLGEAACYVWSEEEEYREVATFRSTGA